MATLPNLKEDAAEVRTEEIKLGRSRRVLRNLPDSSDPVYKAEHRRQMAVIAEHDRQNNFADRIEPDEEDLKGWV